MQLSSQSVGKENRLLVYLHFMGEASYKKPIAIYYIVHNSFNCLDKRKEDRQTETPFISQESMQLVLVVAPVNNREITREVCT